MAGKRRIRPPKVEFEFTDPDLTAFGGASDAQTLWAIIASLARGQGSLSDLDALRADGVASALLDRLLHHAVVINIEGASHRLRQHTDLVLEHVRANAPIAPPPPSKGRGRPPANKRKDTNAAN